jgi:hypothetical protein
MENHQMCVGAFFPPKKTIILETKATFNHTYYPEVKPKEHNAYNFPKHMLQQASNKAIGLCVDWAESVK